jgi:hypothetical protein
MEIGMKRHARQVQIIFAIVHHALCQVGLIHPQIDRLIFASQQIRQRRSPGTGPDNRKT